MFGIPQLSGFYMTNQWPVAIRVDRNRLYAYKRGHFFFWGGGGGGRPDSLKIDMSVDEGIEYKSEYQIRKRSIHRWRVY